MALPAGSVLFFSHRASGVNREFIDILSLFALFTLCDIFLCDARYFFRTELTGKKSLRRLIRIAMCFSFSLRALCNTFFRTEPAELTENL
jgi:hypothetical protein